MTIASTTSKVSYNGSGSTGPFPITYKFTKNADITAIKRSSAGVETVLALTTDYTLTGAGDAAGGSLTLNVALAVGESLVIARTPGIVQEVDYVENSAFPAETHESALDLLTTICQSLQEQIGRSVKVEISSTTNPDDLLAELAADVASAAASAATATTQAQAAALSAADATSSAAEAQAAAAAVADTVTDLADDTDTAKGAALIGFSGRTVRAKLLDTVSVKDLGAVGDGTTDDTAAFVALALLTGTLYVPAGTYRLTSGITVKSNQRWVLDPNAIIDATDLASSSIAFSGYGTEGTPVALSSNALAGSISVVVDSVPTGCVAGAMVRVACDTIFDSLRTANKTGEMAQVLSVASTTVTLASTLALSYLTSANATLSVVTPIVGFSWQGGKILGNGSGQNLVGVTIARAYRPIVEDIVMDAVENTALQFIDCMGGVISRPVISNASLSTLGYGVSITSACKGVLVEGGLFYNCRHATTTTCSVAQIGIPIDITFKDCQAFYTSGDCFDTHCPAWNIRFINCVVHRTAGNGFNIECPNASIIDCIVYSTSFHGVSIASWADINSSYNISNLKVFSCASDGVHAAQGTGVTAIIENMLVRDCNINATGLGVYVFSPGSQINQNVRISRNKIKGASTSVVYAEQVNNLVVSENLLNASAANGYTLRIRDCLGFNVVDNTHVFTTGSTSVAVYVNATGAASCTQGTVSSQRVMVDATGADLSSTRGLVIDNNATSITVGRDNDFTLTGTPFTWGSGAGHTGGGIYASATYDPPSLLDAEGVTTTVTCTGAALGMNATASFSLNLQGIVLTAYVSAANTVSVRFQNESGGTLNLSSGTLRVAVTKMG